MKTIRTRIKEAGHTIPEFLDYVKTNGRWSAMRLIGIKTYDCLDRFLKEATHDPNFGISHINRPSINYQTPKAEHEAESKAVAFLLEIDARIQTSIARKKKRLLEIEQKIWEEEARRYANREWQPCDLRIEEIYDRR